MYNGGPAPADPRWPEADPLDIRPYLQKGKNVLAAEVLYFGLGDGTSPIGKPGFICKLEVGNRLVASDSTWLVSVARSWPAGQYKRHYVRAFQEEFDANRYPDGWRQADYTPGSEWVYAMELGGVPTGRSWRPIIRSTCRTTGPATAMCRGFGRAASR